MKNIILGLASVAILAGGVVYITSTSSLKKDADTQTAEVKKTTIESLLSMAGSQKCTFQAEAAGVKTSGTIYLHQGAMRADTKVFVNNIDTEAHTILTGNTAYMWGSAMPQGVKMNIAKFKEQSVKQPKESQSFDMTKEMNYSCSGWSYDASYFTVPSNVTFMDINQMMQGKMGGSVPNGTAASMNTGANVNTANTGCDACNQVPEGARAQCKAALNCK
jgi:hypothetical protein